jgi:CHASE1-domain containing sensor protein
VAASASVGVLWATGRVPDSQVAYSWWNWWMGDFCGVLVGLPLTLALWPQAPAHWRDQRRQLGLPLGASAVLLGLLYFQFARWEDTRLRTQFEHLSEQRTTALKAQLKESLTVLEAMRLYAKHSEEVTASEFREFTLPWTVHSPQILAMGLVARVPREALPAFEQRRVAEGLSGFAVHDRSNQRPAPPPSGDHWVVGRVEPYRDNMSVLGLAVDTSLSAPVLERAMKLGVVSATAPYLLLRNQSKERGVVLFTSVHPNLRDSGNGPLRVASVFVALRLDALVSNTDPNISL